MTIAQIELIEGSFKKVQPIADQAAQLFYTRLFETNPRLRPLFRGDMVEQGRKLMFMLGVAVASLRRLDQLTPGLEDLGRRHAGYGVQTQDYDTVGSALLWTLEQGLGDAFTPEVESAWGDMYSWVASTMQRGAAKAAAVAA